MMKHVEHLGFVDLTTPEFRQPAAKGCESDEFRMYAFKVKRCAKNRAHDWTQCPYAHRGEKARRRDPCKFNYSGVACPEFRQGGCRKGDACEFAHGVFEFWLHPARYRTRACKAGRSCQRKVCFFAHTPEQLRSAGTRYACAYRGGVSAEGDPSLPAAVGDLYEGLRALKIADGGGAEDSGSGGDTSDTPDIDWVWELLN